eukprot:g1707.t1
MTSTLLTLVLILIHALQGCRGKQPLLDESPSIQDIKHREGYGDRYTTFKEKKSTTKVQDVTKVMQSLSDNVAVVNHVLSPPGAAEFDTLSSSNILMKHKCFSPQLCVSKERSKEFSLRTLQLWGPKVQASVDTSIDRVLQNVSTWYTTDNCIPLHIFIHGVFVVLDNGVNPARVFTTALEATLECNLLVNLASNQDSLQSKKALVTHQDVNNNMPLSPLKPSTNRQLNHKNVTISQGRNQPRYLTSCSSCPSGKTCGEIVEASNTNACSGNNTKITSSTECQNAANRLGYIWKNAVTDSGYPSGCYRKDASNVYYNKHSAGSASSTRFPICQGCILECPAGQYLPTTSSQQCNECPKGRYATKGSQRCPMCPAGRYGSTTGLRNSSCTGICDSGRYATAGSQQCNECPKGRYATKGSQRCPMCPAGRYGSTTGLRNSSCTGICDSGRYATAGSQECNECPKGRYGSTAGISECIKCPPGRYGSTTGLQTSSCTDICDYGQYAIAGSQRCNECPKGHYGVTKGMVICTMCPSGRYGSTTGLQNSSCTGACGPGSPEVLGSVSALCGTCPQLPSACQVPIVTLNVSTETELKNAVTAANNGGTSSFVQGMYHCNEFFKGVNVNMVM